VNKRLDGGHGVVTITTVRIQRWHCEFGPAVDNHMLLAWHNYGGGKDHPGRDLQENLNMDVIISCTARCHVPAGSKTG
jgi:hypothetical protein